MMEEEEEIKDNDVIHGGGDMCVVG